MACHSLLVRPCVGFHKRILFLALPQCYANLMPFKDVWYWTKLAIQSLSDQTISPRDIQSESYHVSVVFIQSSFQFWNKGASWATYNRTEVTIAWKRSLFMLSTSPELHIRYNLSTVSELNSYVCLHRFFSFLLTI